MNIPPNSFGSSDFKSISTDFVLNVDASIFLAYSPSLTIMPSVLPPTTHVPAFSSPDWVTSEIGLLQRNSVQDGVLDMHAAKSAAKTRTSSLLETEMSVTRRKSSIGSVPPPPKSISEKAKSAMAVLNRYRIAYQNDWDMPVSILNSQELIEGFLTRGESIELILPGFPFKSSNRSKKVLGALPDEAERVSLLHLNGLCESIRDATSHDSHLTIISDGISYNGWLTSHHEVAS